ncbi:MAG: lysophospholipid acyltransferase family protein, partial [Clostridia bacterium]
MNKFVSFLVWFFRPLIKLVLPVKLLGDTKIEEKKLLITCNHMGYPDPLYFAEYYKNISFLYKKEFRNSKFLTWAFDGLNFIAVSRGETDISAIRKCIQVLNDNKLLGLFPDGHRSPDSEHLQEFKNGAALIALKAHAPIKPCAVWDNGHFFRKNYIMMGEEFTLDEYYDKHITKATIKEVTALIVSKTQVLFDKLNAELKE